MATKNPAAATSPPVAKTSAASADASASPRSTSTCAETRRAPGPLRPEICAAADSPTPIISIPMTTATTSADASNPNAKGIANTMEASATSIAAWMGRGMSLASVMSVLVVTPEHAFLCERGHNGLSSTFCHMNRRSRLDTLLVERGIFESRSRAAAAVMAGEVCMGPNRVPASKPGMLVAPDAQLEVAQRPRYVSRGGQKLERALAGSGVEVENRLCLDVGASTGGFTDCLLK